MEEGISSIIAAAFVSFLALILLLILAFAFRWLWNSTIPDVFGLKTLTLFQAIKILLLVAILFGNQALFYALAPYTSEVAPAEEQ